MRDALNRRFDVVLAESLDRFSRNLAELDSGAVKTIPWAEVRRRLSAR